MCGCSGGGGRNAFWRTFLIGDGGGDFRGRFGAGGMWYLDLGGDFVTVVVEVELGDLELGVKAILRLVWGCLRGKIYFLLWLSPMLVEGKMPNVDGCLFAIVMWAEFLRLFFFFNG